MLLFPQLFEFWLKLEFGTVFFKPELLTLFKPEPKPEAFKLAPFKPAPFKPAPFKAAPFKLEPLKPAPFKPPELLTPGFAILLKFWLF